MYFRIFFKDWGIEEYGWTWELMSANRRVLAIAPVPHYYSGPAACKRVIKAINKKAKIIIYDK